MKITKVEAAVLAFVMILLAFTSGFFCSRSVEQNTASVDGAVSAVESAPSETPAEVTVTVTVTAYMVQQNTGYSSAAEPENIPETSPAQTDDGRININTASAEMLETLPGIGTVLAQRIVDYRTANGAFTSVEEIKNVSGIGDKKYENIRDLIKVE